MNLTYLFLELKSTVRNARFVIFTLIMPSALFVLWGRIGRGSTVGGIDTVAYLMVSLAAFGGIFATLSTGSRIAVERSIGWNRLLRLTPLRPATYLLAKGAIAMLVALPALLAVFGIGRLVMQVQLRATQWLAVVGLSWLALVPFAVLGIVIGYLATADSVQPITSGLFFLLGLLGGLWFPIEQLPRVMQRIAEATPSYWLAALARSPLTHHSSYERAGLALAAWTVVLGVLAARRFRADAVRA